MNTLDITSWKQKDQDLVTAINKAVKPLATSKLLVPIPDELLMTQSQYDQLMALNRLDNMFYDEQVMFVTPYNAMEVRVKGRSKGTFLEVMDLSTNEFAKWDKKEGYGSV